MGVRANALFDHQVPDYRNQEAVLSLLASSLPAVLAVEDYWQTNNSDCVERPETWNAYHILSPPECEFLRYNGPGGFSVGFGEKVAFVRAGCRWSGFFTITSLRRPHIAAFKAIARTLGGTRIALIPDDDHVMETINDGRTLDEYITSLEQRRGSPQTETDILTDEDYATKPRWYVESLSRAD